LCKHQCLGERMVESKVLNVIKKRLKSHSKSKKPINEQVICAIRQDIYKSTRKYKSAPFAVIRKWIKEARADMSSSKKKSPVKKPSKKAVLKPKVKQKLKDKTVPVSVSSSQEVEVPKISQSVKRSLDEIKSEISIPRAVVDSAPSEVSVGRAPLVLDKVYLQSMSFEMASMRQALDRIGRQLDKLERELSAHRNGEE